jgi:hypothetical protein
MKYRDNLKPILPPEAYIALWRAASQPKPKCSANREAALSWRRIAAHIAAATGLLLLIVACSPKQEPIPIDGLNLIAVYPESSRSARRAKTLPRVEGNPFQL